MIGRVELRKEYKEQTGEDWKMLNPTAQPTIDYVKWLESKLIAIPNVGSSYSTGDEVLYVGTYVGIVQKDRTVLLRDGTIIGSLDSQPQKFRRIV